MQAFMLLEKSYDREKGEEEDPSVFNSQAVNAGHRNYSTYEPELLDFLKACQAVRVILLDREVSLRTDHSALCPIFNYPPSYTSRVAMSLLDLKPFPFTVNDIKGEKNGAAYNLSRINWPAAAPKAGEIVRLAGEIELDTEAEECHSDCEEEIRKSSRKKV